MTGKTRIKPFNIVLLVVLAVVLAGIVLVLTHKPQAPEVTFNTLTGQKITMASLRGKVVYVDFWATSCPGCVEEAPKLNAMYQKYHARGLEMIGVNMNYDPPNYVLKFVQDYKVPYPDALDPQSEIAHAFGDVQVIPTSFLIDKQGRILQKFVGEPDFTQLHAQVERELQS